MPNESHFKEPDQAKKDLEDVLNVVMNQLKQLSVQWKLFCQLFDSGGQNIKILNSSGSAVFALLQRLIIDDVMLSLYKLTDSEAPRHAKSENASGNAKSENASIKNVVAKAKSFLTVQTNSTVSALIVEMDGYVKNVRTHRNKSLAHADLKHALKVCSLPPVTYDELEKAMKVVKEIVSKVASEACGWTVPVTYNVIIPFGRGGDSLLNILKLGHCGAAKGQ